VAHEIALAALVRDGRILLAHRHPERKWYPDCWDLIGGHVEPDESPEEAVRRECREEAAVEVSDERRVDLDIADPDLVPHAFLITTWVGEPVNAAPEEHDALAWFRVDELAGLTLAHPSYATWLPALISAAEPD
jgi:8-oxo-dGTP pyrophosphatase MutT (NUDIX family)